LITLQGQVIFILATRALCQPEDEGRQHEENILRDVGVAIVLVLLGVVAHDVFEHENTLRDRRSQNLPNDVMLRGGTYHATSKTTCHHSESNEQEQARPPDCTSITKTLLSLDAVLIYKVHDKKTEEGEESGNPVDEGDMHRDVAGGFVVWRVGMRR
jgi:hypothetical protein